MSSASNSPASPETWRVHLDAVRDRHQVRTLKPEGEGFSISQLLNGVRGFTYAPGQPEVPLFAYKTYNSFEFHKTADGTEYVIGFVTPSEAKEFEAGTDGASIKLFLDAAIRFRSPWPSQV